MKNNIESRIKNIAQVRGGGHFFDYQPGNGTRYFLCAVAVEGHHSLDCGVIVSWLIDGDNAGKSMFFPYTMSTNPDYVAQKMSIGLTDAVAICVFARDVFGASIGDQPGYDMASGLQEWRIKCQS